jgi:hypothetical protein
MTKGVCSTSVQTQTDDSLNRLWPGLALNIPRKCLWTRQG